MSLANTESVKIIDNETILSGKVNIAVTPTVNLSKKTSFNEIRKSSQKNLDDSNGANDKKEPKIAKSKKKKRNARKGKIRDALSPPQNDAKDEIKAHESVPEKPGEVSIDSDKEEHKNLKAEALLDQTSIPKIHEHEIDPTFAHRQTPTSRDDIKDLKDSGTTLLELNNLGTKASNLEDANSINVPENILISLSDTAPITPESKQQDTSPNSDGSSEISHCKHSFATDNKQDKFNLQESTEDVKELKNPHLVVSSIDESVKEDPVTHFKAPNNNPISETKHSKVSSNSLIAEIVSIAAAEDNANFTPSESVSRSLVPEKTFIVSRDDAVNKKTSEVIVQNEDSITPLGESSLASTSKILINSEDNIVIDTEQTLSTINLSKLNLGNVFQEPKLSSSTRLKESDLRTQMEQQTTGKIRNDNNETGISPLPSVNELMGITSELLNVNSGTQIMSSENVSGSNASVNAEISENGDLLGSNITTNEHVISELPDISEDVRNIVLSKVSTMKTSTVLDGNIISNMETDFTEPPVLAEKSNTPKISLTHLKESNKEIEVIKKYSKETTEIIDAPFETDGSNDIKDKFNDSDDKKAPEPIGDISTNEEAPQKNSDPVKITKDKPICLFSHSKTLEEHGKEITPDFLTYASDTEVRSTAFQDHADSTSNEISQLEIWKNPLESTAGKDMSFIDTKVTRTSNLEGVLRHSNFELPNCEMVSTTSSECKNDEAHSQNLAPFPKIVEKDSQKCLSNSINLEISNIRENIDSAVDFDEVKNGIGLSASSLTDEVFGSSASQAEINNKIKLKFKPSVGDQALAPELVTISKETLDLLYKRLDSMQLEIERLSSAHKSQNETTQASPKDKSNSNLKDNFVVTESKKSKSKITEGEEIVNVEPSIQPPIKKPITKPSCLWRLISMIGYKKTTKSDTGLVSRSASENLFSSTPLGPKGKGKEIVAQLNKQSAARTYKVIGRVRAKHDLS